MKWTAQRLAARAGAISSLPTVQLRLSEVDDDMSARSLLSSILRNLGYDNIHSAPDGAKVMRMLERTHPAVIFMDIEMPGRSGLDILPNLMEKEQDIYVVIVSGHATMDNVKKALELGARGFIVKPYMIGKVEDAMNKYHEERESVKKTGSV